MTNATPLACVQTLLISFQRGSLPDVLLQEENLSEKGSVESARRLNTTGIVKSHFTRGGISPG